MQNSQLPRRSSTYLTAALGWLLLTLGVAGYALLKPSNKSSDLPFLPATWARWLDSNYDLRTLLMTVAVALPPALVLRRPSLRGQRRKLLLLVLVLLVGSEFAQLWIATRTFSWPDVGYTILGIVLCEVGALLVSPGK